jgi:hypothetical protein
MQINGNVADLFPLNNRIQGPLPGCQTNPDRWADDETHT